MSLPPALQLKATPGPAVMLRMATIFLTLVLGLLMMFAANHAQAAQGETGQAVPAELDNAVQPLPANDASQEIAGGNPAVGLATVGIVLIACCALGLALQSVRAWRANLFRRLNSAAKPLWTAVVVTPDPLTCPARPRPSLVALSISRT